MGQIYMTNKTTGGEFTRDDEVVIEMLASYAAVALSNARLVEKLTRGEEHSNGGTKTWRCLTTWPPPWRHRSKSTKFSIRPWRR